MCPFTSVEFEHRSRDWDGGWKGGLGALLQLDPGARYIILGGVERMNIEPERPVGLVGRTWPNQSLDRISTNRYS